MKKTNFDKCSYMESCELYVERDEVVSGMWFEDDFEAFKNVGRDSIYFFTCGGQIEMPSRVSDLYDFSKCSEEDFQVFVHEIDSNITLENSCNDTWKDVAMECFNDYDFRMFVLGNMKEVNNSICLYSTIEIRGYCQGDYAQIVYKNDSDNDLKDFKTFCTHIFYDLPIYIRLTVDEEEYTFDECLKDSYNYDKKELVTIAKENYKLSEKVCEWFETNLPDYI
jgi:hypothetical protein